MSEEQRISDRLRLAREQQDLSIEEVHQKTGLSIDVLRGMEEGRFDLVEPVFTRMALREYAGYLGLEVDAILERYDQEYAPPPEPEETSPPPAVSPIFASVSSLDRSLLRAIGLGIAVLVVLLLIVSFFDGGEDRPPGPDSGLPAAPVPREAPSRPEAVSPPGSPARPAPLPPASDRSLEGERGGPSRSAEGEERVVPELDAAPPATPAQAERVEEEAGAEVSGEGRPALREERESTGETPAPGSHPLVAAGTSSGPDSLLSLEVEAIDSTWVQVKWDGEGMFEGIIPRGERRSWQARDHFLVRSGRAHGLRYWFQGELLGEGRLGDPTRVLRFTASRSGVVLLGPDLRPLEPLSAPDAPAADDRP